MNAHVAIISVMLVSMLTSCGTGIQGYRQEILINTTPQGAECKFFREGELLGVVAPTPGSLNVRKEIQDIMIFCNKPGYKEAITLNEPDAAAAVAGNFVPIFGLLSAAGAGVDYVTGASNQYDSPVEVKLIKVPVRYTPPPPDIANSQAIKEAMEKPEMVADEPLKAK